MANADTGALAVQGYGSGDIYSSAPAVGAGWLIHSAVVNAGSVEHFKDGVSVGTATRNYLTENRAFVVGREIQTPNTRGYFQGAFAAVLVYSRALSSAERQSVEAYLAGLYLLGSGASNLPPVASDDSFSVEPSATATWAVLANDSDSDGTLDASTVTLTSIPAVGTATVNPSTGEVQYQHNGSAGTSDSFTYTVADNDGAVSNQATVTVTIIPNQAPVAANDTASVVRGASVEIPVLSNDLDSDGTIDPSSVTITAQPAEGTVTGPNPVSGALTYATASSGTLGSVSFTYTVTDDDGAISNVATVTVTVSEMAIDPPVLPGLVMHYRSDGQGVTSGPGGLTLVDQSANGNDLAGAGNVSVISQLTPSGLAALSFDGSGDFFERQDSAATPINGLPTGSSDRTMFFVARYDAVSAYVGMSYGNDLKNRAFGLIVNSSNNSLAVQGYASGDFNSSESGVGVGWLIQSAVVNGGVVEHFKDGTSLGTANRSYNTENTIIALGREIGTPFSNGYLTGAVAAVLLYDRALTSAERASVESYLNLLYLQPSAP